MAKTLNSTGTSRYLQINYLQKSVCSLAVLVPTINISNHTVCPCVLALYMEVCEYFLLLFTQTIPKTLNPQWREQFDFHLYDEQGGFVDITVWDKDAGKKDDFMGRYSCLHQSFQLTNCQGLGFSVCCQIVQVKQVEIQNYRCI